MLTQPSYIIQDQLPKDLATHYRLVVIKVISIRLAFIAI